MSVAGAVCLRYYYLSGRTSFNPGKDAECPIRRVQGKAGLDVIINPIEQKRTSCFAAGRLPGWVAVDRTAIVTHAVFSYTAFLLIQFPICSKIDRQNFLQPIVRQNSQILNIDPAVANRCRADIHRPFILVPVFCKSGEVCHIDYFVAVEVGNN